MGSAIFHERLQNEHCGKPIDHLTAATNAHISLAQDAIGFSRSQAFVPEMNRQMKALLERLSERFDLLGLRAGSAAHV